MTQAPLTGQAIPDAITPAPESIKAGTPRRGDRLFKLVAAAAGSTIVAAIALIAIFLLVQSVPSLLANHANFFTSAEFNTTDAEHLVFGIRDLLMVTVLSSAFALVLAVPVAVGIAVFLTQYAPTRLSRPFGAMVGLLAAVPSIIFGLWGIFVLAPKLEPLEASLNRHLGWLFLFKSGNVSLGGGGNIFTAGIVSCGDDPADRLVGVARGISADPQYSDGGSAGARRDQVGGGADDRTAVRSKRCRRSVSAGFGPRSG
jgi:phosphate transport system permease protein